MSTKKTIHVARFHVTSSIWKGPLCAEYWDGTLAMIELPRSFRCNKWEWLSAAVPFDQSDIEARIASRCDIALKFDELKVQTAYEKFVTWCEVYKRVTGRAYVVNAKKDPSKFTGVPVTEELVEHYLQSTEWWSSHNSIGGYCSQVNKTMDSLHSSSAQYTGGYNPELERKMSNAELPGYWRYLRSIGLVKNGRNWVEGPK